jgi:hypothetical protein
MWGALLGASGYVPLPLCGADYLELLPVRWHPVTGRGIRINHRTYAPPPPTRAASGRSTSTRTTYARSTSRSPNNGCLSR